MHVLYIQLSLCFPSQLLTKLFGLIKGDLLIVSAPFLELWLVGSRAFAFILWSLTHQIVCNIAFFLSQGAKTLSKDNKSGIKCPIVQLISAGSESQAWSSDEDCLTEYAWLNDVSGEDQCWLFFALHAAYEAQVNFTVSPKLLQKCQ